MADIDPYSASRIKRGAFYLVGGKAITALAGIGTFLLLVRALPVEQFAAYSILFGLVELVDAITSVGLSQVLSRYVPELLVQRQHRVLRRLVAAALVLRVCVLVAFLAAIYAAAPLLSPLIGLTDWEWAVRIYLAVVLARVAAASLFSVLESMLHQAIAQLGFGFVTVLRFGLMALAVSQEALDLNTVILIELVTDAAGCGVMLIGLFVTIPRDSAQKSVAAQNWIDRNIRRMSEFGLKGYFQHLLILPYGGATNRVLVGGALTSGDVALFGFAQTIADLMERYLPVKFFAGIIRPVLTARYVRDHRFADLEAAANLIFKLNATLICLIAVAIYAGNEALLKLITTGKYSEGGVSLLLVMCALVIMYSLRFMLDHLCHAVERNGPLLWSNAVITSSVLLGIAALPFLGVYAMPIANIVGLVAGSLVIVLRLRKEGFPYRHDLGGFSRLLMATGAAMGLAGVGHGLGFDWKITLPITTGAYIGLIAALRIVSHDERRLLLSVIRARKS